MEPSVPGGDDGFEIRTPDEWLEGPVALVGEAIDYRLQIDDRAESAASVSQGMGEGEGIAEGCERPRKGPHELHRWKREILRNYVVFMGSSGLRPNEARQLRWRDVVPYQGPGGVSYVILHISPNTKTGARERIPLRNVPRVLERVKDAAHRADPDDLIFCDREGNAIDNFGKTFKSVLKKSKLLKDRFNQERTIYSLRHTYATFRIRYGGVNVDALASNMGTSPSIIFRHYRHIPNPDIADILGGKLHTNESRKGLYL